jgi:RNA polymerase sigma-70 factor (ECF subfamily)
MRTEIQAAIDLIRSNSPDAVPRSISLLQNAVYEFSMRFCGRREDAEDTSQEVLLRAVALLPHFTNAQALMLWLYKVAKSRCLNSRRRSKFAPARMLSLEEMLPGGEDPEAFYRSSTTPEALLMEAENMERVMGAVRKLPPRNRIVLVLHDMEGLQSTEIADILQLDERAVRVRLHRARLFVRAELAIAAKNGLSPAPNIAAPEQDRGCEELIDALSDYPDRAAARSICRQLEHHLAHCRPCQALGELLETASCPTCLPAKSRVRTRSRQQGKLSNRSRQEH